MATVRPLDRAGRCPFDLVDPAPHHYRIQGYLWDTAAPAGPHMRNADVLADTAEEAEAIRVRLSGEGYKGLSVLSPQCDGRDHY